jgi:hypothetical protein
MSADHVLTIRFAGNFPTDSPHLSLECLRTGADRPCAVIECPVDHEFLSHDCIAEHGAVALDKCWAVEWLEAAGPESLNTEALRPVSIPVRVSYDEGVVLENAETGE